MSRARKARRWRPCYMSPLWSAIVAADHAWSAELGRTFGRQSGDARYDGRGRSTPRLLALHRRLCRLKRRAGQLPPVALLFYRKANP
jgi:hypothetical protein